jgi:large subunit ribosomal protein L18
MTNETMASKLKLQEKAKRRQRRRYGIKRKIRGTAERPRLVVFRSNTGIYAQLIDDAQGFTLAQSSTRALGEKAPKSELSKKAGMAIAAMAKEKGITNVIFDRNGYLYHGRVKALADGAREGGLQF